LEVKRTDLDMASEEQAAGKQLKGLEDVDKLVNSNDQKQLAIKSLLDTASGSADDKLATLKAAHHVDKDRFQSAFISLMGTSKSRRR
jgi:hypothetical protein